MIGQVTIGKSFGGLVRYVMEKDRAEVIDQGGVRSFEPVLAIQDFNQVRSRKSNIKNAVWHTSISFAYEDQLNLQKMISIGQEYLEKIGLKEHQYLMVRHHDTRHDHIHIIANRIGYEGELASDKWCKNRTAQICDGLEKKYGLTIARNQGRDQGVSLKTKTATKIKNAIEEGIIMGLSDYDQLEKHLNNKGIKVDFQVQKTGRINGVSFTCNKMKFKGSSIDKNFSYKRLARRLAQNNEQETDHDQRRKN